MSKYEIGRDIQELRARIERIEGGCWGSREPSESERQSDRTGSICVPPKTSVDFEKKPILWELEKEAAFPPFLANLFGYPPNVQFNIAPQSKTWTCVPEPLVVYVNWDAGGTDEHFRFSDQVFSIIKVTDPNTGIVTATAIYTARLTQRSGLSIDWTGGHSRPNVYPWYVGPICGVTLRGAGGASLFNFNDTFSVVCGANHLEVFQSDFPPGVYDLVAGATWQMGSWRVARC